MKHIKPFNENKEIFIDELKDFCEINLAYLLDDESIKLDITNNGFLNDIRLYGIRITSNNKEWSSIKDHMIPFLTRLQNKYNIIPYPDGHDILIRGRVGMKDPNKPVRYGVCREYVKDLIKDKEQIDFYQFRNPIKTPSKLNTSKVRIVDLILHIQQKDNNYETY